MVPLPSVKVRSPRAPNESSPKNSFNTPPIRLSTVTCFSEPFSRSTRRVNSIFVTPNFL